MDAKFLAELWYLHSGKIIGVVLGFVIGILILVLGFLKTLFVILCALIGYFAGKYIDSKGSLKESVVKILDKFLPPGSYR